MKKFIVTLENTYKDGGIDMEEKKLTDDEIIREYFHGCKEHSCENCPLGDIENCMIYVEDLVKRQKAEIERLTEENKHLDKLLGEKRLDELTVARQIVAQNCVLNEENAALQKQVDELAEERENMQAEIMRFEDMKFTQEHCDLYAENEWLKASLQQSVKDTAKEILQTIKHAKENGQIFYNEAFMITAQKAYGVEVE